MEKTFCCCGSQKRYDSCCGPYLNGTAVPDTPEKLMRSRYSAFCTHNIEYLVSTHHPSAREPNEREMLTAGMDKTQWLGLKIIQTLRDQIEQGTGFVEFTAFYEDSEKKIRQLHENARFVYEANQWYYQDGVLMAPLKINRNEPCWCGSGKKFKRCHG